MKLLELGKMAAVWKPKNKCVDCLDKNIDEYGWLCDLSCWEHSRYLNQKIAQIEILAYLNKNYGDVYLGDGINLSHVFEYMHKELENELE
jgi:hypothetical protein